MLGGVCKMDSGEGESCLGEVVVVWDLCNEESVGLSGSI